MAPVILLNLIHAKDKIGIDLSPNRSTGLKRAIRFSTFVLLTGKPDRFPTVPSMSLSFRTR